METVFNSAGAFASDGYRAMDAGALSKPRYTVKDVTSMLGISRTTLLWYEKIGIVEPARDSNTGWRTYSDNDVFGLLGAMTLKNSGLPYHEQPGDSQDYAFTPGKIDGYIESSQRQEQYCRARTECLRSIRTVILANGQIDVGELETFYFFPFRELENGGEFFARHLPLTALGCMSTSTWGEDVELQRGWSLATRLAHLIELPAVEPVVFGGQTCLSVLASYNDFFVSDEVRRRLFARMDDYMLEQGLVACGKLFIPRVIPFDKGGCSALCLPVERAAVRP